MSGTTRFIRSYEATGRLKSGLLSGSEELRRHGEGREYRSWEVPGIVRPVFEIGYRFFQGLRRRNEASKLRNGDYNILPEDGRDLYVYPLDR